MCYSEILSVFVILGLALYFILIAIALLLTLIVVSVHKIGITINAGLVWISYIFVLKANVTKKQAELNLTTNAVKAEQVKDVDIKNEQVEKMHIKNYLHFNESSKKVSSSIHTAEEVSSYSINDENY